MTYKSEELNKVQKALEENGKNWEDKSDSVMERIHFWVGAIKVSVICGPYSYGGNIGLLESMPPTNETPTGDGYSVVDWARDVEGCLTAEEVINTWILG